MAVVNEGSGQGQLSPLLEQIHARTGGYPDAALVDGGFASKAEVEQCAAKPKDETWDRREPLPNDNAAVAAWRQRMGTAEAKALYKERAATAEGVNAIARNRGLRQFAVRGLEKAKAVLLWFALAHNVMREVALRPATA